MNAKTLVPLMVSPLLLVVAGCGDSNSKMCEISGTLTYKGKPIPGVYLRFEPDDLATKSTSMAVTEADGRFEMFVGSTPGVFKGKVKVFCDDPLAAMGNRTPVPPDIEPDYRELCAKYGAGKSKYEITITESDSNLELKLE